MRRSPPVVVYCSFSERVCSQERGLALGQGFRFCSLSVDLPPGKVVDFALLSKTYTVPSGQCNQVEGSLEPQV